MSSRTPDFAPLIALICQTTSAAPSIVKIDLPLIDDPPHDQLVARHCCLAGLVGEGCEQILGF